MKIWQCKDLHRQSKFHGSNGFKNLLQVKTATSKRALVDHSTSIENEQDQSICIFSRCSGVTNDLIYNNQINSIQHNLSLQSICEIPTLDFLQSFRKNGAQFISSAYLWVQWYQGGETWVQVLVHLSNLVFHLSHSFQGVIPKFYQQVDNQRNSVYFSSGRYFYFDRFNADVAWRISRISKSHNDRHW